MNLSSGSSYILLSGRDSFNGMSNCIWCIMRGVCENRKKQQSNNVMKKPAPLLQKKRHSHLFIATPISTSSYCKPIDRMDLDSCY
mmetsp:Transcript_29365/g.53250  ORF Transcript_29365/g.53250 Transcript_29365/m.53250 type:complete len:85 (-) Transcript_29365:5-259(-)